MTLIQLVEATAARLAGAGVAFGHGTDNAFDEAVWLVLWRLGVPFNELEAVADMAVSPEQQDSVHELVTERISSRKPTAYLTREAWLEGVPFYVDERAIVPRSFIAQLLATGDIDPWLTDSSCQILDLCTGNGSLAVLASMAYPEMKIHAADISRDALAIARINVDRHGLGDKIRIIESDGLRSVEGPYDLILCNPPYVNARSMSQLPPEFRAEPQMALAGGADGMDFIRTLLREAPSHLSPDGVLVLEIGNERANFEAAFPKLEVVWLETNAGEDQVLLATLDALRQ